MPKLGCSIASILLLTAVLAVIAAAISVGLRSADEPEMLAAAGAIGFLPGILLGALLGTRHERPGVGAGIGALVGAVMGPLAAAAIASPGAFSTLLAGALLLVGFGVVVRMASERS